MRSKLSQWILGIGTGIVLCGCVAAERSPPAETSARVDGATHAGWYMQHAGQGTFQPCGQSQLLQVSAPADLPVRARAFGLDEDTPIYVRVTGSVSGSEIAVSRVDQFGSSTPVRNCAMNGVVIPAPTGQ